MEKKQNVPALRFQGFSGEWEKKTLGDFGNVAMNRRIFKEQTSETGEIPFYKIGTFGKEPDAYISRQLFEEYKAKYPYPDVGDILLSAAGSIGKTVEYTGKDEYFQDSNIVWLKHDERLDNPFLKYFYSKVKWGTLEGGTVKRLYNKILLETEIVLPEIIEQKKIGKFFASYDRMIAHQEGKIRKLQQFRQAMLTKLFPWEGAAEPELRFRGFSGKWKQNKLGDLVVRITRKNSNMESDLPLTISAVLGLVSQREYFNNRVASGDVSRYYLIKKGEFAYNKSYSDGYPFGAVKRLDKYDKGVLSTLYIIFSPKKDAVQSDYLAAYYDTTGWYKEVAARAAEGARNHGLLNISPDDFFDTMLKLPESKEEQQQIGTFFKNLDDFISLQQKKLERMQRLKAALLEKLFV